MTDEVLKVLSTLDDEQTDIVIKYFHAHCGAQDMSSRERDRKLLEDSQLCYLKN